ncbi:hypothetical protein QV000_08945 [Stenotrophomonas maltophilia]
MVVDKVNITFHAVSACGFYRYGEADPEFGLLPDLLDQLKIWSAGKSLGDTQISNVAGGDVLPVYLYGIDTHVSGAVLISMWNELPVTGDNNVTSVAANDLVGKAVQHMNPVKKGTIPGFPTYFLFLPGVDAFATLKVEGLITAQAAFQGYCEQFWATKSSYAVKLPPDPEDPDLIVTFGYRDDPKDDPNPKLYPRFRTKLFSKPAVTDEIVKRWDDIREVQRSSTITFKTAPQRKAWQQGIRLMEMSKPASQPKKAKLHSSLTMRLSKVEVQKLILDWGRQAQNTDWDDYGFRFKNESKVNWLSQAHAKGGLKLDGIRDADGTVSASKLLEKIMKHKTYLHKLMK